MVSFEVKEPGNVAEALVQLILDTEVHSGAPLRKLNGECVGQWYVDHSRVQPPENFFVRIGCAWANVNIRIEVSRCHPLIKALISDVLELVTSRFEHDVQRARLPQISHEK